MVYSRYRLKLTVMSGIFLTTVCGSLWAGGDINFKYVVIDENGPGGMHTKSVGDLNGDGLEDLLVAGTEGAIVWYENPSLVKYVITTKGGKWSTDAEIGDIDGDGDNDIVISDWYQNNRIVWFENSGVGESWTMHIIGQPRAHDIELGDLDRDGDLDIVTRTQGGDGNKIQIWRQDSGISWTRRASPVSCPSGEGLSCADIDRDGDPDIVIAQRWYETPSDIVNGTFVEHIYCTSWTHSAVVAKTGDVNNDKKVDIVLTPSESKGGSYRTSWFEAPADPTGNWVEHIIDNGIETVTHALGVGDMDGDGDLDVVTAEMHQGADPDEVRVYINNAAGLSWKKQVVATTGSHNMRLVDLGGDGDLDIFGANWSGSKKVELWENLSGPYALSLDNWTYIELDNSRGGRAFGLAMDDLTGDGYGDIVSGMYFYRSPGGGMKGAWSRITFRLPAGASTIDALLIVNVDNDQYGDVIAMDNNGKVYWLEADDTAGNSWSYTEVGDVGAADHGFSSQGYVLAQLVAGGRSEIIINVGSGTYYFEIPDSNPDAGSWPRTTITTDNYPEGIGVGDVDKDGDTDICGTVDNKKIAWWQNPRTGAGNWTKYEIGSVPSKYADRFYLADLNGDTRLDIVVSAANGSANGVYWFECPADPKNPGWTRHTVVNYGSANTMNSMDVADMDRDGDIDIISGEHRGAERVTIWENDRSGNFTEHIVDTGKESHLGTRVVDLDGDGDLEIISIAWDDYKYLHLWRNDARAGPSRPLKADLNNDGIVDFNDLETMARDWLVSDSNLPVVEPDDTKLVAHWPMNEGSGDTAADIVGGHHGTLKGATNKVQWAGEGSPTNGDALSFNGYTDGVSHTTDPGTINWVSVDPFDVVGPGITLAAWIRPEGFDVGDARIITKQKTWSSIDIWWMLSTYTDGTALRMRLKTDDGGADDGTTTVWSDTGYLQFGVWSHAAATYDGSKMRLYHNGVEIMSTDKTGTIQTDPTVAVAIGNGPLGDPGGLRATFHGLIDDLRIYKYALLQDEMAYLADVTNYVSLDSPADLLEDGKIDFKDYAILAGEWLERGL